MAALTPAIAVGAPAGYCARLEQLDRAALLKMGLDGAGLAPNTAETALGITAGSIAAQALQLALDGYVEFDMLGQTETNDTVTTFNLTDRGVDFLTVGTYRRVEVYAFITSDAEAALIRRDAMVTGAATPVVVTNPITFQVVDAGGANQQIGHVAYGGQLVAAGDFWVGAGANAIIPDVKVEQSGNKIRLSITGVTNVDMFWRVKVRVYPLVAQTFPVTD